jgi:hypothetical protein
MDLLIFMPYFSGFIAFGAFVITLFGATYCDFLTFTSNETVTIQGVTDTVTLEFGVWYYRGWSYVIGSEGEVYVFETCWNYPEETVYDANWKSAKAFNTMALIIGGMVVFVTMFAACSAPSKKIFQIAGMSNMVCCLFTGLSLLLLNSNACNNNLNVETFELAFPVLNLTFPDTCTMGVGAKTTISATVLWFVAAIAACMSGPNPQGEAADDLVKEEPVPVDGGEAPEQAAEDLVKGESAPVDGGEVPEQAV